MTNHDLILRQITWFISERYKTRWRISLTNHCPGWIHHISPELVGWSSEKEERHKCTVTQIRWNGTIRHTMRHSRFETDSMLMFNGLQVYLCLQVFQREMSLIPITDTVVGCFCSKEGPTGVGGSLFLRVGLIHTHTVGVIHTHFEGNLSRRNKSYSNIVVRSSDFVLI